METKTLSDLIAIKSFDLFENKEIINYLEKRFFSYAEEIVRIKNPDNAKENLVIGINCKLKNTNAIILSGHIDTVVADEKAWFTNPYEATEKDGKIYGLGAIDMKCFFASIIDNIEKIKNINVPIIVCITCDEETKVKGIEEIIKFLNKRNVESICTIIGEPTSLEVHTISRSANTCRVQISGKSCHSSNPKNGVNAIYIASRFSLFLEKLSGKFKNVTTSAGVISGGEKFNIVAGNAYLDFDLRCPSIKDATKIDNLIEKEISKLEKTYSGAKIEYSRQLALPPLEKHNSKIINSLIKKFNLKEGVFIAAAEAGIIQSNLNCPTFIFGAGDLSLAHKPNEYLDLKNYEKYNQLLISMLNELAKTQKSSL